MITSWASGRWTMPRIARRVVCGRLLVIATLLPTRAFIRVDLPTLGRPAKLAKPDLNSPGAPGCAPPGPAGPGPGSAGPVPDAARPGCAFALCDFALCDFAAEAGGRRDGVPTW